MISMALTCPFSKTWGRLRPAGASVSSASQVIMELVNMFKSTYNKNEKENKNRKYRNQ